MAELTGTINARGSLSGHTNMGVNPYIHPATHDYETEIVNKPQLNSVELVGNKSFDDIGLEELSNTELEALLALA